MTPTPSLASLPRRARLAVLAGAVSIALGSIVFAAHYSRAEPAPLASPPGLTFSKTSVTVAPDAPAWSALEVGTPTPANALWTDSIPARVAFDEARTSRVGSPLAGRIASVLVESGQTVTAGTPLFTVNSSGLVEMHTDAAKAAVELKTAQIELERTKALVEAGSLPAKEVISATQNVTEAQLAGQLAAQKLGALAGKQSGGSMITIVAPRDGVVVEKHVAVGQQVDASAGDLVAIADLSSVWIVADLFETDAASIVPGAAAQVSVDEGATQRDATVAQVASIVDPDRHTVPVRIQLDNRDGTLRPNAHAQVRLRTQSTHAVLVPAAAVLSDGAKNYVYIVTGETMLRRDVVVGNASDGQVPVLSGLRLDDKLVTKGGILLDNAIQLHDE